jgi:adenylate cyclase
MAFEIERKFLVIDDAWHQLVRDESYIRQAYLTGHDKASIRVRIRDNRTATLTVKSRGADLKRLELEYEIPVLEAEAMLPLRRGAIIEKRRVIVPVHGHLWEVDTFFGENAGLVLAEIELDDVNETFVKPQWIGAEVTSQASYYNSSLANHPFAAWTERDRRDLAL